ncbi:hypothetical protein FEM48_Zijuj05G0085000 [Ziziphus jujuba var. spinosa]|uniref:Uncharacterized protein n=1 Tax=Ziziphus jujuba var. spinosa TaxID=714518 RepID=A0A978VDX1_ZIZJJ|nr:hypothetical protein FEM48_Zijuj05G0085000 [Ziziphus jujuba var. spinosa]
MASLDLSLPPCLLLALSATVSARPDAHVLDLFDLLSARNHVSDNFVRVVRGKNEGNMMACCDACYCIKACLQNACAQTSSPIHIDAWAVIFACAQ